MRRRIESESSELIAIYGRRRVGKTFLVRQYFNDAFGFYSTGIYQGTKKEQLGAFNRQLEYYSGRKWKAAKDWFEAFAQLREYLESLGGDKPIVVFLDELPWMDTQKGRFIKAFEYFWNSCEADCLRQCDDMDARKRTFRQRRFVQSYYTQHLPCAVYAA